MSRDVFLDGVNPVSAAAVIPGDDERTAVIVLVVDDEADDELVAAIAAEEGQPIGDRFGGVWSAKRDAEGAVIRFELVELEPGDELAVRYGGLNRSSAPARDRR